MQSRTRTVFPVLFLTAGIVCLVLGALFWLRGINGEESLFGMRRPEKEPFCRVEFLGAEEVGKTYGGIPAEEGYSFYELEFSVKNEGSGDAYGEMPSLYFEGEDYDDVYDEYYWKTEEEWERETGTEVLFEGYCDPCIPPGRTGSASQVVQVKDGVRSFSASYYPGYSDEERFLEIKIG